MKERDVELAERIRTACLQAAQRAYEEAGISGLCEDGRWECAMQAIQGLDVKSVLDPRQAETRHRS